MVDTDPNLGGESTDPQKSQEEIAAAEQEAQEAERKRREAAEKHQARVDAKAATAAHEENAAHNRAELMKFINRTVESDVMLVFLAFLGIWAFYAWGNLSPENIPGWIINPFGYENVWTNHIHPMWVTREPYEKVIIATTSVIIVGFFITRWIAVDTIRIMKALRYRKDILEQSDKQIKQFEPEFRIWRRFRVRLRLVLYMLVITFLFILVLHITNWIIALIGLTLFTIRTIHVSDSFPLYESEVDATDELDKFRDSLTEANDFITQQGNSWRDYSWQWIRELPEPPNQNPDFQLIYDFPKLIPDSLVDDELDTTDEKHARKFFRNMGYVPEDDNNKNTLIWDKGTQIAWGNILEDLRDMDTRILDLFKKRDYKAKDNQARYRRYQIYYMILAAAAAIVGSLQALFLTTQPTLTAFLAFFESAVVALVTFIATISSRESPLDDWITNRRRAEALRREYFRFLLDLPPYNQYGKNDMIKRRRELQIRAAKINAGNLTDEDDNQNKNPQGDNK